MGTRNKSNLAFRGFASVSAFLLAFTSFGSVCAESYASQVNSFLGVKTTKMVSDTDTRIIYASSYGDFTEDNLKKLEADVYDHIEREEEEGAVLLSNDGTLPLETGKKVSLFGFACSHIILDTITPRWKSSLTCSWLHTAIGIVQCIIYLESFIAQGFIEVNSQIPIFVCSRSCCWSVI